MNNNEEIIRNHIATWLKASGEGDIETVRSLMDADVAFLVAGQPPMRGRDAFAAGFAEVTRKFRMEANSEVKEIRVDTDLAYSWTHLSVTMTPLEPGDAIKRSGFTLSVWRKQADGDWLLFRDANLLTPQA